MARGFRLEIASPKTATAGAKTWVFAPSTGDYPGRLIAADVALKKEKRAVSHLTVTLHDPTWEIFSSLPDPAFFDVPVRFYLEAAAEASAQSPRLVFDGVLTRMEIGYPGPTQLQITAHDRSVNMRQAQTAALKTFRNKTSVQIATEIINGYGYQVATDLGAVVPKVRKSHIAVPPSGSGWFSDWDVAATVLDLDGLEMYMAGETVTIREKASAVYPTKYTRGDSRIIKFSVQITHVATPGKKGDFVVFENAGTIRALDGNPAKGATKEKAQARTHRVPVGGPTTEDGGAASEIGGNPWGNLATASRRRKDKSTLELQCAPEIGLQHIIRMGGFGAKSDGRWEPESITHRLFGSEAAKTTIEMHRGESSGGAKGAGIPFEDALTRL